MKEPQIEWRGKGINARKKKAVIYVGGCLAREKHTNKHMLIQNR